MKTDKESITAALKLWFREGDVFEIRVLDAVSPEWMRPHMESGYFDYEHIPDAAEAICRLRACRGAYATVNPVNPDLLARACNRLRGITREATTADTDIVARRWLLIDCDPKRVSGVSSSDAEHEAAGELPFPSVMEDTRLPVARRNGWTAKRPTSRKSVQHPPKTSNMLDG